MVYTLADKNGIFIKFVTLFYNKYVIKAQWGIYLLLNIYAFPVKMWAYAYSQWTHHEYLTCEVNS